MPLPKKVTIGRHAPLQQTCGLGEVGYFRYENDDDAWLGSPTIQNLKVDKEVSGCGWIVSSFTPGKKVYKDAYNHMVERFGKPLFQSEVRVNKRTNHKFFFCIFDAKGK